MGDQLELHMQRFFYVNNDGPNEDSDLQQLLTLQSSSSVPANEESAKTSNVTTELGKSSEEENSKQPQEQECDRPQPQSPKPLVSHLDYDHMPTTRPAEEPPVTIATERFLRMTRIIESQFESPKSYVEIMIKLLWILPVVVVIGDHCGWSRALQWTVVGTVVLNINPDSLLDGKLKRTESDSKTVVDRKRNVQSQAQNENVRKELLEATKAKLSHLLGLAGAPPPLWSLAFLHSTSNDEYAADVASATKEVETNKDNTQQDNEAEIDLAAVLPPLVHFVESHVQFLLSIDQALDYLRRSASIHLGLGPQSQCVERVEQAAMAREFRQLRQKHQQPNTDNPKDDQILTKTKKKRGLEPQRGPSKSVLSLVTLRRNLAKSIIHQSGMLDAFWKHMYCIENEDDDPTYSQGKDPLLEMPYIVNLAWIKGARHILAESLSGAVEEMILVLQSSSSEYKGLPEAWRILSWLEDADAQTQQLTQHLRGTLLLPNENVGAAESTTVHAVANPNDPLFHTLLNFRSQLDALGAALWSCQQYCNSSNDRNMITDDIDKVRDGMLNTDMNLEEGSSLSQREWWSKIQQLSETCRAFETEITHIYFPQEVDLDDNDNESDGSNGETQPHASQETGDYAHGENNAEKQCVEGDKEKDKPTKTAIFSGKGKVEERPKHRPKKNGRMGKGRTGTASEDMDCDLGLPQRDLVSESAMISELQNRIKALIQDEEVEQDESDSEEQDAARLTREPTAPLFLGASGSLLAELKQSISMEVLGSEICNDEDEEIRW